jgi:hypothetical protein
MLLIIYFHVHPVSFFSVAYEFVSDIKADEKNDSDEYIIDDMFPFASKEFVPMFLEPESHPSEE